jgi:hypothetical protein
MHGASRTDRLRSGSRRDKAGDVFVKPQEVMNVCRLHKIFRHLILAASGRAPDILRTPATDLQSLECALSSCFHVPPSGTRH